jgi:ABC-type uncharacterized transport system permease subunit
VRYFVFRFFFGVFFGFFFFLKPSTHKLAGWRFRGIVIVLAVLTVAAAVATLAANDKLNEAAKKLDTSLTDVEAALNSTLAAGVLYVC